MLPVYWTPNYEIIFWETLDLIIHSKWMDRKFTFVSTILQYQEGCRCSSTSLDRVGWSWIPSLHPFSIMFGWYGHNNVHAWRIIVMWYILCKSQLLLLIIIIIIIYYYYYYYYYYYCCCCCCHHHHLWKVFYCHTNFRAINVQIFFFAEFCHFRKLLANTLKPVYSLAK